MHKRILFYSALLAVLVVACAKGELNSSDVPPEIPTGEGAKPDTLYTVLEQPGDTKLEFSQSDNKYSMLWEVDETITVLCDNDKTTTYTLNSGSGTASGTFIGTLPEGSTKAVYAVLSGNELKKEENALTFTIPQERVAVAGNSGQSFPAVAKVGDNGSVALCNVMGLLRVDFTFTGTAPTIKKIVLRDLAGNDLYGTCKVPINADGSLDYKNATITGGGNTIALKFSVGTNIDGKSYFFPIPVGALDGGFSIVLYEADDTKTDGVGRAYSFLQKITGTTAMLRSYVFTINANVTEKAESQDVKARGYYKSLFVNAGISLDAFRPNDPDRPGDAIPAIEYMGLENDYEYLNTSNTDTQTSVIIENGNDANGVLLYPDGSPRFRLVFNRGGNSIAHGTSLGATGRGRFKTFFDNGGSYSGVCAGAFLAANTVPDATIDPGEDADFTFNLIPVSLTHTSLPNGMSDYKGIYTNMAIRDNAKSIISSLNGDGKFSALTGTSIADVMHHGGGFLPANQSMITGVEALMTYQFSETHGTTEPFPGDKKSATYDDHYYRFDNYKGLDIYGYGINRVGEYSTWAYKNTNGKSGRAVCSGSHPEVPGKESHKQFTGFMFRYAMEGNGDAVVKSGDLTLGQTRYMNATPTGYSNPAANNAGIGDGQYHHFKFTVPAGGYDNIVLRLDSACDKDSGIDLYLGLRKGGLAWLSDADYTLCNKGGQKEIRIKHLPEGDWYVSVFCATKVTASQGNSYCSYSGKTQVLNGVPYSICIAQDGTAKEYFPSAFGEDGDDFSNTMDD